MKCATPSTHALIAFAATARHLSFTKAAVELCMTQGAVSRQVASLEEFVNAQLFVRLNPGLQLTAAGESYLPKVETMLRELEVATRSLRAFGGQSKQITVSCHSTLASVWLLPKLDGFRARFGAVTLNLQPAAWERALCEETDIAIRFGGGAWPHLDAQYLGGKEFVAVAASRRSARSEPRLPSVAADCVKALCSEVLLHHARVPDAWPLALDQWRERTQSQFEMNPYAGPKFATYAALLQAAVAGYGVAIVPEIIARGELGMGRLVRAVAQDARMQSGYYLCTPHCRRDNALVRDVVGWLLQQAEADLDCAPV